MTNLTEETASNVVAPPVARRPGRRLGIALPTLTLSLTVGLILTTIIALFGLIAPLFVQDPNAVDNIGLTPPGAGHLLGTTQTGQDVLAQLAHSTAGSLRVGLIVGVLATVLSAFFGILGAYVGGVTDELFSPCQREHE